MSSGFWILLTCQEITVSIFLMVCISKNHRTRQTKQIKHKQKTSKNQKDLQAELLNCEDVYVTLSYPQTVGLVTNNLWVRVIQSSQPGDKELLGRLHLPRWLRFPLPQPTVSNEYMFEKFLGCDFCWRCLISTIHHHFPTAFESVIVGTKSYHFSCELNVSKKGDPTRNLCSFPVWSPAEWCPSLPSGTVPGVLRCLPSAMLPWWLWNPWIGPCTVRCRRHPIHTPLKADILNSQE